MVEGKFMEGLEGLRELQDEEGEKMMMTKMMSLWPPDLAWRALQEVRKLWRAKTRRNVSKFGPPNTKQQQ